MGFRGTECICDKASSIKIEFGLGELLVVTWVFCFIIFFNQEDKIC